MTMGLLDILKSREYRFASEKIDQMNAALDRTDEPSEVKRLRDEISIFFADMWKARPDLYAVFQVDDKAIAEKIVRKLFEEDVMIN